MPHERKLAVIGLGYVGLPVAVAFGRQGSRVIGFDIDSARISELKAGRDRTREVDPGDLAVAHHLPVTDVLGHHLEADQPIVGVGDRGGHAHLRPDRARTDVLELDPRAHAGAGGRQQRRGVPRTGRSPDPTARAVSASVTWRSTAA